MHDPIKDPNYWLDRAKQTRAKAERSFDRNRAMLLRVAAEYDYIAEVARRSSTAETS
jgi:hypothetical protein